MEGCNSYGVCRRELIASAEKQALIYLVEDSEDILIG